MSLKRENKFVFSVASAEIFILVCAIFAFGFLVSETNFVSAQVPQNVGGNSAGGNSGTEPSSASGGGAAAAASAVGSVKILFDDKPKQEISTLFGGSKTSSPGNLILSGDPSLVKSVTIDGVEYTGQITKVVAQDGGKNYLATIGGKEVSLTPAQFTEVSSQLSSKGIGLNTPYEYSDPLGVITAHGAWGHLYQGLIWAGVATAAIQLIGPLITKDKNLINTINIAAVAGIFAFKGIGALGPTGTGILGPESFFVKNAGLIGIGVAVAVFVLLYKKETKKYVQFQCLPWEAPLGGAKCEECNKDPSKPCSEYRCKSLGQACNLVNPGTKEEACVWVSPQDVASPTITPWKDALLKDHKYTNHATRPPSLGANIERVDQKCIRPFTPLQFGVVTNEPAQCKIDYEHKNTFDEMVFYLGESNYFLYNHTQTMRLPSPDAVRNESPELQHDGNYNLYIRCRDANGNENVDEFVYNFCVDESPDTTPPVVESSSIISGSPVTFGVQKVPLSIYVNEPAECKWSITDKAYSDMENTMRCSTKVYEQNAEQLYACSTELTGIKDRTDNVYYFRCKDQPGKAESERNTNTQSYRFNLRGSQTLNIISAGPNGTIIGSSDVVPVNLNVETSNGADEGKAICYFSPTGATGSYIAMFGTNSFEHNQTLSLTPGSYSYYFRCVDAGGNSDNRTTSFTIFVDRTSPIVTRIYREIDALKIVTNEDAECSYSLNNCNFNVKDGIKFIYSKPDDKKNHFTQWKVNKLHYVRCADKYGNEPASNLCNLIVSPSSVK